MPSAAAAAAAAKASFTYKSTVSLQQQQQQSKSATTTTGTTSSNSTTLKFDDGAIQFRQRICVAILTHRRLLIRNIRNNNNSSGQNTTNSMIIGLQSHEASFLKLIDAMTNGSKIEINATGTQLLFQPGILLGGTIHHDCPVGDGPLLSARNTMSDNDNDNNLVDVATEQEIQQLTVRNIGWYLEGILPLAPFGKEPLHVTLTGITDNTSDMWNGDPSCDYLRITVLPLLSKFGIGGPIITKHTTTTTDLLDDDIGRPFVKVIRRGGAPLGGGCVQFHCPIVRTTLQPNAEFLLHDYTDVGKIKRIRGTVITCQLISSSVAARTAYAAKGICHKLLPDVWIHTDIHTQKNQSCGPSPSVNMILTAETTTGVLYTSEVSLRTSKSNNDATSSSRELPEDLGVRGAIQLLQEIQRGGCIDTPIQSLALLLTCLCPEQNVCRVRIGPLSPYTIVSLRLFQQALGVTFKVQPDPESKTVLISGIGIGYKNMARAST